jgi:hypothetical protein
MKVHLSGETRSVLLGLFAISLGLFMALTTFAWFSGSSQTKMKVIEKRKLIGPEIVSIVEIQRDKKTLGLGEEFDASGDWLRGAKFKLRNESGKEIVYISFELEFPETTSSGSVMVFPIWMGQRPGTTALDTREPLSLKPDKRLTISIDDLTYARLVQFIETRQPVSSISKVIARVQFVLFEDGTGWSGGEYLHQDPKNPKAYVPMRNN